MQQKVSEYRTQLAKNQDALRELEGMMHPEIVETVKRALAEDIGTGDITSRLTVPADRQAEGKFYARADIVVAGIDLLPLIYELVGGVEPPTLLEAAG